MRKIACAGLSVVFLAAAWTAEAVAKSRDSDEDAGFSFERELFETRDSLNNKVAELEEGQDVLIEKLRAQIEANQILEAEKEELEDLLKEYRVKKHSTVEKDAGPKLKELSGELAKTHEKYRKDVDKLSGHLKELTKLNQKYQKELRSTEKAFSAKDRKIGDAENQVAQARVEFAKLTAKNQALNSELDQFKADRAKSPSQLDAQIREDFAKLGAENQTLKAELERLKAESLKSQDGLNAGLDRKLKALQDLNREHEARIRSFTATLADKDKKTSDVEAELAATTAQFEKFSAENQTLKAELDGLKAGSVRSQTDVEADLSQKIKTLEDLDRKNRQEIQSLTDGLGRAQAEAARLADENFNLQSVPASAAPASAAVSTAPAAGDTAALLKKTVAEAEARSAVLARELAKLKASESDYLLRLERLENEGAAKDEAIIKLRRQTKEGKTTESSKEEFERRIRETKAAEKNLAQKVLELERLNQKYTDEVKSLSEALAAADKSIAIADSAATRAKSETARLAGENEAFKSQTRKLKESYDILLSEMDQLRTANAKSAEALRRAQEEAKRNGDQKSHLQKTLKSAVQDNSALKKKLDQMQKNIRDLASRESQKEIRKSVVSMGEVVRRMQHLSDEAAITHYNLGVLFMKQGRHTEAVNEFERTIRLNPSHAYAHYNLAVLHDAYLQNFDKAIGYYQDYIRLLPKASDAKKVEYRLFQLNLSKEAGLGKDLRER
ncbi:MAG: tetratricopeptide repeat protein [Candidatus Omnitrophica bacterium]|nr:tetratricopeptide repeat protein [Candidatus Omnitrophota bacterium]